MGVRRLVGIVLIALVLGSSVAAVAETAVANPLPTARAWDRGSLVLQFGRVPYTSNEKMLHQMGWIQDYFRDVLGVKAVRLVLPRERTYAGLVQMLQEGLVDVAWLSTNAYVHCRRMVPITPLVKPIRHDQSWYRGLIIVRKDRGIKTLQDLRGKRIAWVDRDSSSGYAFPRALLIQAGLDPERDLAREVFLGKHDSVVWNVFLGKADAGACYDDARQILKNPLFIERLDILARTPRITNEPIVCRPGLPADLVEDIRRAFLDLSRSPRWQDLAPKLDTTDFQGFVPAEDADYDSVREAFPPTGSLALPAPPGTDEPRPDPGPK